MSRANDIQANGDQGTPYTPKNRPPQPSPHPPGCERKNVGCEKNEKGIGLNEGCENKKGENGVLACLARCIHAMKNENERERETLRQKVNIVKDGWPYERKLEENEQSVYGYCEITLALHRYDPLCRNWRPLDLKISLETLLMQWIETRFYKWTSIKVWVDWDTRAIELKTKDYEYFNSIWPIVDPFFDAKPVWARKPELCPSCRNPVESRAMSYRPCENKFHSGADTPTGPPVITVSSGAAPGCTPIIGAKPEFVYSDSVLTATPKGKRK